MANEKTKTKTVRLKISTLASIEEMAIKAERKQNWVIQKILDMYFKNIQKKQ